MTRAPVNSFLLDSKVVRMGGVVEEIHIHNAVESFELIFVLFSYMRLEALRVVSPDVCHYAVLRPW